MPVASVTPQKFYNIDYGFAKMLAVAPKYPVGYLTHLAVLPQVTIASALPTPLLL